MARFLRLHNLRMTLTATRLGILLTGLSLVGLLAGLVCGSDGCTASLQDAHALMGAIRLPRSLGAWLTGAALGLAGAIAQGLFRNPLADPYLLGAASGAGLAVTATLALAGALAGGWLMPPPDWSPWLSLGSAAGLAGAAFLGALLGTALTLLLAGGMQRPVAMLLAGVVVGMLLGALSDLITLFAPQALRARQSFLLGSTSLIDWIGVGVLGLSLVICLSLSAKRARLLDALILGEDTAASLGLDVASNRLILIGAMTLATGTAVAQAGLIGFIGLAAPHLVRRAVPVTHAPLLVLSALCGGTLLLLADVMARTVWAPGELPVGLLTAILGGTYLLVLLHRRTARQDVM